MRAFFCPRGKRRHPARAEPKGLPTPGATIEQADRPQSGAVEITLKYPIQAGGKRIERLTMRRSTRADMKAAAKHSKDEGEQQDSCLPASPA